MGANFMVDTGFMFIGFLNSILSLLLSVFGIYALLLSIKALKLYLNSKENNNKP